MEAPRVVSAHRRELTDDETKHLLEMTSEAECRPLSSPHRHTIYHLEDYYLRRNRRQARVHRMRAAILEQMDYDDYLNNLMDGTDDGVSSSTSPSRMDEDDKSYSYFSDITL